MPIREKKPTLVITFDATTQALAAERLCRERGLPGRLIPVPREITAGCGLAWKAAPEEKDILATALETAGIIWTETHIVVI